MTRSPLQLSRHKTASGMPFVKCSRDGSEVARVYMRRTGRGVTQYELGYVHRWAIEPYESRNVKDFAHAYWLALHPVDCSAYERPTYDHSGREGRAGASTYPYEYFGPSPL